MSFAVIELKRADAKALARARTLLGVAPATSLDALKSAFRARAKTAHPDAGGDPARFKALVEARTLLSAFAERRGADAIASIRLAGAKTS
jgi:curved DNA-binding protein CbpA